MLVEEVEAVGLAAKEPLLAADSAAREPAGTGPVGSEVVGAEAPGWTCAC